MNRLESLRAEFLVLHGLTEAEIDRRVNQLNHQRAADIDNLKEQVGQARIALEHRLDAMNAFREENREQAAKSVTREVMDQMVLGLRNQDHQQEERIRSLESRITTESGAESALISRRKNQQAMSTLVISFTVGIVAVVSFIVTILNSRGR